MADGAALAALHAACFPAQDAWGEAAIATMLALPGSIGLWLPENGLVLAHVAADEAEILTLCIVPAARRRGLGATLLAGAMAAVGARGAAAMSLEVAEANPAARALYDRAGFARVGRRPRYYRDGGDALVLRRPVASPPLG